MLELLDTMRDGVISGDVVSLGVMAEMNGNDAPILVLRGRFKRDPHRAAYAMIRAQSKLNTMLDGLERQNLFM